MSRAARAPPRGDVAIVDGASSAIKATVRDYTNSNPVAVTLTDTNGDPASVGAGTQYTEDAAAPANPVGTAVALGQGRHARRRRSRPTVTSSRSAAPTTGPPTSSSSPRRGRSSTRWAAAPSTPRAPPTRRSPAARSCGRTAADTLRAVSAAKPLPVAQTGTRDRDGVGDGRRDRHRDRERRHEPEHVDAGARGGREPRRRRRVAVRRRRLGRDRPRQSN